MMTFKISPLASSPFSHFDTSRIASLLEKISRKAQKAEESLVNKKSQGKWSKWRFSKVETGTSRLIFAERWKSVENKWNYHKQRANWSKVFLQNLFHFVSFSQEDFVHVRTKKTVKIVKTGFLSFPHHRVYWCWLNSHMHRRLSLMKIYLCVCENIFFCFCREMGKRWNR